MNQILFIKIFNHFGKWGFYGLPFSIIIALICKLVWDIGLNYEFNFSYCFQYIYYFYLFILLAYEIYFFWNSREYIKSLEARFNICEQLIMEGVYKYKLDEQPHFSHWDKNEFLKRLARYRDAGYSNVTKIKEQ